MNYPLTRAQIEAVAEQIAPMCDGDEQLLQDMLEGETDLISVVSRLHEQFARDTEMLAGIKERAGALAARKKRIDARVGKIKTQIGALLRSARLSKLELPEATYSVRDGKPKLVVNDPDAVPREYQVAKYAADKHAINESFADCGELPNWLSREPGADVVTVRNK